MKCCSRSTLGIVIGSLNAISCAIAIIASTFALIKVNTEKNTEENHQCILDWYNMLFPAIIVLCLILGIISALLVAGIVKGRHNLMLPWIILSVIIFICNCVRIGYEFIVLIVTGVNFVPILIFVLLSLFGMAISGLILFAIYNLYRDIREENINKPVQDMNPAPVEYNYYKSNV